MLDRFEKEILIAGVCSGVLVIVSLTLGCLVAKWPNHFAAIRGSDFFRLTRDSPVTKVDLPPSFDDLFTLDPSVQRQQRQNVVTICCYLFDDRRQVHNTPPSPLQSVRQCP